MALTWLPKKRVKIKLLILTGLERFIVFIANIKDSDITVNGFLFEIKNGQKLPVKKGCLDELQGESPLRLNNAVIEIVRIGAESLNEKDQVPGPIEGNSGQNETESTAIAEADEGIPGENGMCGTLSIEDKDKTVSASTSASESKEIVDNSGRENSNNAINNDNSNNKDNISRQNNNEGNNVDNNDNNDIKINAGNDDNKNISSNNNHHNNKNSNNNNTDDNNSSGNTTNNNNSKQNNSNNTTPTTNNESKTEQEQEKTGTQTKLPGTPATSDGTASKLPSSSLLGLNDMLQTPSNEKHPNEPQKQVTIEQQPNRASVTPSDEPAPLNDKGTQETEPGHDKSVLHRNNNGNTTNNNSKNNNINNTTPTTANNNNNSSNNIITNNNTKQNNSNNSSNGNNSDNNNKNNSNNNNNSDNNNTTTTDKNNANNSNNTDNNNNSSNNNNNNNTDNNNSNNSNAKNESKTGQEEKTGPQTKLEGTPVEGGGTAFKLLGSSSSLSSTRYLKSTCNSSKNKLQTPSNEEHSNEPQQQVTIEQQPHRASSTGTKLSGTPVEGGGIAFEIHAQQHNGGSHYHNFTPDQPAPQDKERGETEPGHGKSVVIHQPELQNENSIVHVSSEKDNPSNQEDSDGHLSSNVRKGRRMGFSCGLCFSCSS
jgi:hypothetical protein